MAITTATLYTESREVLKNLIRDNVDDPKDPSKRRRWIYREFPDTTSHNFGGYPIIVINSPDVGDDVITLNQRFRDDIFTFSIEIYAEFNDTEARVDTISDAVVSALLSDTNQTSMADNGLFNPNLESSPFTSADEDGKQLSARLITVEFSSELCY